MYWDHMNGWGWTMMTVWSLVWVGFLGVIVWATVHWVRTGSADAAVESRSGRSPAELLDERLARGEIDVDEYERRRAALSHGTNRPPDDT
ncbi:MAG TPA: SHOCT domain-containing protein [Gaiellales bacterium]|jgi:putative membrane protein|nr:SHOCT domain-containing protein [Gaiellales bacterium]